MIYFDQPTPNGVIYAKQTHNDGCIIVIATCGGNIHKVENPALSSGWEILSGKLNTVAKMVVAQAIANAYMAVQHVAVLKDLLEHHADSLAIKE